MSEIKVLGIEDKIIKMAGYFILAAAGGFAYEEALEKKVLPFPDPASITVALYATLIRIHEQYDMPIEEIFSIIHSVLQQIIADYQGIEGPKRNG